MRDLAVILTVFLGATLLATVLSVPVWNWAEQGYAEWKFVVFTAWTIGCFAGCQYLAVRVLGRYREATKPHRAYSEGRNQNS